MEEIRNEEMDNQVLEQEIIDILKSELSEEKNILIDILENEDLNIQGISLYLYSASNSTGKLKDVYSISLDGEDTDFNNIVKSTLKKIDEQCEIKEFKDLQSPNGISEIAYIKSSEIPLYKELIYTIKNQQDNIKKINAITKNKAYKESRGYIIKLKYNESGERISNSRNGNESKEILYFGEIKKSKILKPNKLTYIFPIDGEFTMKKAQNNLLDFIPNISMFSMHIHRLEDDFLFICNGSKFENLLKYDKEKKKVSDSIFVKVSEKGLIENIELLQSRLDKKRVQALLYVLKDRDIGDVTYDTFKNIKNRTSEDEEKIKFILNEEDNKILIDNNYIEESIKCILSIYADKLANTLVRDEIVYAK